MDLDLGALLQVDWTNLAVSVLVRAFDAIFDLQGDFSTFL